MKKLMIGLFAVCAAVAAQAAYVDWQYMVNENKSGGTDWTSGHTAYLLTEAAWTGLSQKTAEGIAAAALDSSAFYLNSGTKSANVYSTGSASPGGVRQVTGDTGKYYVILTSGDGYNVAVDGASITAYTDPAGAGTGLTPGITISTPTSGAGISYTAYDVPEPTGGLLMLVGLGALALRRRRA